MPEIADERILFDGQQNYVGGATSNVDPMFVEPESYWWGKNIVIRGGFPRSRPGFRMIALLPDGKIQGALYYKHTVGSIAVSIGGKLARCDVKGNNINLFDISPDVLNAANLNEAWMVQAGPHLIVQDGQSKPIVHDGSNTWRTIDGEVPVGTRMAFGNARLWVSNGDKVLAGDLYGLTPESHLDFSEATYLATGGSFVFPGEVTAMGFLPRLDAVTEQGELMVFTRGTTSAVRADIFDRTLWQNTAGMQRLVYPSIGCEGQRSLVAANQDLYFRSRDGIRSIRSSLQDSSAGLGKTSISTEASRVTSKDTARWRKYISGARFDNRLLMTAAPRVNRFGTAAKDWVVTADKILSLDSTPFLNQGKNARPAWDGEWTGLNVVQLVSGEFSGVERCFAVCVDCAGRNALWEITKDYEYDLSWPNETVETATDRLRKSSYIELRQMDFQKPFQWKTLERLDLLFFDAYGPVDWRVEYRGEMEENYTTWDFGTFGFAFETCELTPDVDNTELPYCSPPTLSRGSKRVLLGTPKDFTCSDGSGRLTRYSREYQLRISWTGQSALNKFRIVAQARDEAIRGECQT